ncbi:hypothetical protein LX36DRAFT_128634 [Colletotrichum falcatum]|nr:hypothetical protein LX36DRAFT_128634 [Colletotrichum falcatum]
MKSAVSNGYDLRCMAAGCRGINYIAGFSAGIACHERRRCLGKPCEVEGIGRILSCGMYPPSPEDGQTSAHCCRGWC